MTQSITLPAAGLMTDPGPFTAAPEGGMLEAQNVVVLRPGVMEPRAGLLHFKDALLKSQSDKAQAMYADPSSNVFVWATSPWIIRKNASTTITGPTSFISGKIRTCGTGGRALNTSENGVCTLPGQLASPASGSATVAYRAGMPQPYAPRMLTTTVPAGYPAGANWLPNGESVAYRVTIRRRLANGTLVESAPSSRVVVTNSAGAACAVLLSDVDGISYYAWFDGNAGGVTGQGYGALIAGDELCIYRSARLAGTPSDVLSLRAVLPWSTTSGSFGTWYDALDDAAWSGAKLYTNETQEGALLANYRPEYARDIALYKNMTFYAGAKSAQTVTATCKLISTTPTDPSQALCTFTFTGDITIGTNTILNCTNIRYFSVGQVITDGNPGASTARFPTANTQVTAINTGTNTVTLSANAGATVVGAAATGFDWVESSVAGSRIYHNAPVGGGFRTMLDPTSLQTVLENRWNGDLAVPSVQLRCGGTSPTLNVTCTWFRPDPSSAAFTIKSSKPLAWDRYIDSVTGVTSQQNGGIAELHWSKLAEPEHVPLPYRSVVGDAAYAIRRIESARNSLLVFKDDGLFQVFGDTPDTLTFELLDRTIALPAPKDAFGDEPCKWVGRFDDRVYAMTTRGPMAITDAGAVPVGAPILESLRRRFIYSYGSFDESLRALMIDPQSRRVGFFYDLDGTETQGSVGYVFDVESGAWTYWRLRRNVADFTVIPVLGMPGFAGGYWYGYQLDDRTMLDDGSVTVDTMPRTYEMWSGETCTITSVFENATLTEYDVTIAAGSEWIPTVGDLLIQGGVAHPVVSVASATAFGVSIASEPIPGAADWRESYEARCVWLARAERNVGAEKHWRFVDFPVELSTLFSRYVDPTSSIGRMKSYFRGYRNTAAAVEAYVDASQSIGLTPWPLAPAWKHVAVPASVARDWALQVGFSIRQAGVWFSTAGVSVLFEQSDPSKVSR